MSERGSIIPFERPAVHGFLHQPESADARANGLVLTHGAGSNCNAPVLIRAASAFCAAGFWVLRCDMEFRRRRPSGPPSPATAAADRAGLKSAMAAMRKIGSGRLFLGGHSYGGRQATVLASDDPDLAHGLLVFSYPLHPPGKRSQLRTEHFPRLRVPCVFVHGTTDPFGFLDELVSALALIPAPTKLIAIEGAGHDLKGGSFDPQAIVAALLAQASA